MVLIFFYEFFILRRSMYGSDWYDYEDKGKDDGIWIDVAIDLVG